LCAKRFLRTEESVSQYSKLCHTKAESLSGTFAMGLFFIEKNPLPIVSEQILKGRMIMENKLAY
jgi:hypothetical protein